MKRYAQRNLKRIFKHRIKFENSKLKNGNIRLTEKGKLLHIFNNKKIISKKIYILNEQYLNCKIINNKMYSKIECFVSEYMNSCYMYREFNNLNFDLTEFITLNPVVRLKKPFYQHLHNNRNLIKKDKAYTPLYNYLKNNGMVGNKEYRPYLYIVYEIPFLVPKFMVLEKNKTMKNVISNEDMTMDDCITHVEAIRHSVSSLSMRKYLKKLFFDIESLGYYKFRKEIY